MIAVRMTKKYQEENNSYSKLQEFCQRFGIKPQSIINSEDAQSLTRIKLIESMCLNVDNTFYSYKSSGNLHKTLIKNHLLKPPVIHPPLDI